MFKSDSKFGCNSILLTVQLTVQTCKVHVNCLFLIKLCKQSQNKWIGNSLFIYNIKTLFQMTNSQCIWSPLKFSSERHQGRGKIYSIVNGQNNTNNDDDIMT